MMSTKQLKEQISAELEHTEDERFLKEIYDLVRGHSGLVDESKEPVYKLSDAQRAAIRKAQAQVRDGEYSTHEDIMREFDEWLDEEDKNGATNSLGRQCQGSASSHTGILES